MKVLLSPRNPVPTLWIGILEDEDLEDIDGEDLKKI
jgi:hypothetical protein